MGFKVKNKKFNIDFDLLICQYAYQVIDGECDDHFFEELIDSIKGYCEYRNLKLFSTKNAVQKKNTKN